MTFRFSSVSYVTASLSSNVGRHTTALKPEQRPALFQHKKFKGNIYRLDEPVFDTISVMRALAEPVKSAIVAIRKDSMRLQSSSVFVEAVNGDGYEDVDSYTRWNGRPAILIDVNMQGQDGPVEISEAALSTLTNQSL